MAELARNEASERLLRFARRLIAFRRFWWSFGATKFRKGRPIRGAGIRDIMWFDSTGAEMTNAEWSSWFVRVLGMLLSGATMDVRDPRGRPIQDGTFLVMLNAVLGERAVDPYLGEARRRMGANHRHV